MPWVQKFVNWVLLILKVSKNGLNQNAYQNITNLMWFWFKDLLVPIPYKFGNADYPTESLEVYNISALIPWYRNYATSSVSEKSRTTVKTMLFLPREECSCKEGKVRRFKTFLPNFSRHDRLHCRAMVPWLSRCMLLTWNLYLKFFKNISSLLIVLYPGVIIIC